MRGMRDKKGKQSMLKTHRTGAVLLFSSLLCSNYSSLNVCWQFELTSNFQVKQHFGRPHIVSDKTLVLPFIATICRADCENAAVEERTVSRQSPVVCGSGVSLSWAVEVYRVSCCGDDLFFQWMMQLRFICVLIICFLLKTRQIHVKKWSWFSELFFILVIIT